MTFLKHDLVCVLQNTFSCCTLHQTVLKARPTSELQFSGLYDQKVKSMLSVFVDFR